MLDIPEAFVKRTVMGAFYMTIGLAFFLFTITSSLGASVAYLVFVTPILFFMMCSYLFRVPDVAIKKKEREINKEIIFAGRFLVIELESGVSLYRAMINIQKSYDSVGRYFKEITDKVDIGTSLEQAINETLEIMPSDNLRKILWQVLSSLKTGADITHSVAVAIDQTVREQKISMEEYSKKLNPLAMFYMMAAVIVPSLGMTMLTIMASFIGFKLSLPILLSITLMIAFVQFMFLAMIRSSRPAVDL